ncbi:hypothetical protein C8J57DRAFT_1295439, partial [Mycena rebaudengoi]
TALLAVLAHHHITRFAALSHSNGLFYALHTLLNLPPSITVTSWTISGPFVPPSISGSVGLRLAAALPASLPNTLGTLLGVVPPATRLFSWSAGLLAVGGGEGAAQAAAQARVRGTTTRCSCRMSWREFWRECDVDSEPTGGDAADSVYHKTEYTTQFRL